MSRVPVSVVVCVKNERANIVDCLRSVHGWADEIVVVDDDSTDGTSELAQPYADKILVHKMENEGAHRNWAYAQAKNEWVLSMDGDERATEELKQEIDAILPRAEVNGYTVPRRNYIGGYWVRYGGQYPAGQLRLFRKDAFKFEEVGVHPRIFLDGPSAHLTKDLVHYSYRDFEHYLAKLNGQTTLEAEKWIQTNRRMSLGKALWRTFDRFPRAYIAKKGYKDGFIGFMVAFLGSFYQLMSYAKYWEVQTGNKVDRPPKKTEESAAPSDKPVPANKTNGPLKTVPLTVVVIAKNEEENIEECLASVYGWADEIIVVDDESSDRTVELAQAYADKIFRRKMENEGKHRNWAYAQARNEWVLSLDADEYVTEALRNEIAEMLPKTDVQSFSMPLKTYIGKYWVRHSGWYPAHKLRMFMKSKQKYEETGVHPRTMYKIPTAKLSGDIVHKGYPDFEHFLSSLNRQTTLEARKWIQTGQRMSLGRAVWRTIDRFPRSFIGKKGYKDGFVGFMIAFFASLYQIMSYAKYWQMNEESKDQPYS